MRLGAERARASQPDSRDSASSHDGRKRTNMAKNHLRKTLHRLQFPRRKAGGWRSRRSGSGLYHGAACAARTVGAPVRRSTRSSRSRSAATSSGLRLSTSCPSA